MYSVCIQDKKVLSGKFMNLDINFTEQTLRYSELQSYQAIIWAPLAHFRLREISGPFKGLINPLSCHRKSRSFRSGILSACNDRAQGYSIIGLNGAEPDLVMSPFGSCKCQFRTF